MGKKIFIFVLYLRKCACDHCCPQRLVEPEGRPGEEGEVQSREDVSARAQEPAQLVLHHAKGVPEVGIKSSHVPRSRYLQLRAEPSLPYMKASSSLSRGATSQKSRDICQFLLKIKYNLGGESYTLLLPDPYRALPPPRIPGCSLSRPGRSRRTANQSRGPEREKKQFCPHFYILKNLEKFNASK